MGALIEQGLAARALSGERVSGDRAVVSCFDGGVLAALIDGLGHGDPAHAAAELAVAVLERDAGEEPQALLERCHRLLKGTRGAAVSLASIRAAGTMTWLGVGNVEARLLRVSAVHPKQETLSARGGVVGYQLPPLHTVRMTVNPGDLLILTTDGIGSEFSRSLIPADPLLRHQPVQEIAERILARFGKATDDATVLVIRYRGLT